MIGIINLDMGNIKSVSNALRVIDQPSKFINKPADFKSCKAILLPGVGSFPEAMNRLSKQQLCIPLRKWANDGGLLVGICLGMQLLMSSSDEGIGSEGLNLIHGVVRSMGRYPNAPRLPHVGWNQVTSVSQDQFNISDDFYFIHSFECIPSDTKNILFMTEYFGFTFASGIQRDKNIFGFQFHPEKSQNAGLNLLDSVFCNA